MTNVICSSSNVVSITSTTTTTTTSSCDNNSLSSTTTLSPSKKKPKIEKYEVNEKVQSRAYIKSMAEYEKMYHQSIDTPSSFWADAARDLLTWETDFDTPMVGSLEHGDVAWFCNGTLNVSTNCIDRHCSTAQGGEKIAIIWEADEIGQGRSISYNELLRETCKIANAMKAAGVKKGDTVAIYMPMVPELAFVMLACTRIGAPHSIVFAGFSSEALRDRILDAKCKWVFTTDEGKRGGRTLPLKKTVDTAIDGIKFIKNVFVFKRTHNPKVKLNPEIDIDMEIELPKQRPYCVAEKMDSEDTLFILYTSGSTGSPKGVVHTTAGYLLYAMMTSKYVFDLHDDDIFACVADCGWITGHTYIVYGPLSNGATTLMFESTPLYPDCGRYWDLVQRHKVTQFYTAPTAIRALMAHGVDTLAQYNLSSLRILGTVGEPINPEAWKWYYNEIGKGQCMIVDTYWQTETGGHIGTGLPGVTAMKPGSCGFPFFGIEFALMDNNGKELIGNSVGGRLCLKKPWPGMARTVYGDHNRYMQVYLKPHPGFYFTGDGCYRDEEGYYWITGRIDDVLSTSGHRIGTAEIESSLAVHSVVAESAVVGFPHKIKGEGICCYVVLVHGIESSDAIVKELRQQVRTSIGAFATPDVIICTPALPKTRSGKIMRRILRKIATGDESQLGDVSTLADSTVIDTLIANAKDALKRKAF